MGQQTERPGNIREYSGKQVTLVFPDGVLLPEGPADS
jgi:hypothetical protein